MASRALLYGWPLVPGQVTISLPTPPDGYGYLYYTDSAGTNQILYVVSNGAKLYPMARL